MNKGKEIVMERENGEEIYAKDDSMKLEGVRACMPAVISDAAFSYSEGFYSINLMSEKIWQFIVRLWLINLYS